MPPVVIAAGQIAVEPIRADLHGVGGGLLDDEAFANEVRLVLGEEGGELGLETGGSDLGGGVAGRDEEARDDVRFFFLKKVRKGSRSDK